MTGPGSPEGPVRLQDTTSASFCLLLDYIYLGEEGLDIFNQVHDDTRVARASEFFPRAIAVHSHAMETQLRMFNQRNCDFFFLFFWYL